MIEHDETPTTPRSVLPTELKNAATVQVPVLQPGNQSSTIQAEETPPLPYMEIDDLLALKIASDPHISPDGSQIAFTVHQCDKASNTTNSSIWLVNSRGDKAGAPRQLTSGEHQDMAARWSPGGEQLAFLSDRSGTVQIFLLPLNGGEARQISSLPQGVTEYSWRPDGRMLLAHSAWKPEDDQEAQSESDAGISLYTRLDAQWDGLGYKEGRYQQLWLVPLEGSAIRLTSEPVDLAQSCWSPDGSQIVFCANRRPDPDLSVSMALWVLTIATGQLRRLTPEDGLAQMPSWSPDGQTIAYLYTPDQTEAGNFSPWLVQAQGNEPSSLVVPGAEKLSCQAWVIDELRSEWLSPPCWYPDSKALLVPVQERGQVHLYRIERESQQITQLVSGNGRYISPHMSKDGQMITLVRADWFTPGDIWSMDSQGKNQRKLTRINDALLHSHQLIRPRRITWQSSDGLEIEGWLYLPALGEHDKAPLILAPHGGPSLAWGDSYSHEFQVLAGRGYAVLAPNPRGSTGYGEEFTRKIINDWGGADFQDLIAGIEHVIATESIDGERLGIGGLSYGGYMTNWAITQTNRFKAAVSRNGISSLPSVSLLSDQMIWFALSMEDEKIQRERSALTFADRIKTPLLLLHAGNDLRCPFNEAWQLFVTLRKHKQTVELVRYANVSHLMDWPGVGTPQQRVDRLQRTIGWFERFV